MKRCECEDLVCIFCHEKEIHLPHPQLERVNASLKQLVSLTIRVSPEAVASWTTDELNGEPGASPTYTDPAIETLATVQAIYGLVGRQTQGLFQSVFELMKLDLPIADHPALSRRRRQLTITLPVKD
jgi:Transposase DDE domain